MRVVGIILVLLSLPAFIGWLMANPHQRKWAYAGVGILPFTMDAINLDAALISWPTWTGYVDGILISLLDTMALAIIVVHRNAFRRLPFLGLVIAYFLTALLSISFSSVWMSSSFYAFQIIRLLIVFVAAATIVERPRGTRWLAFGLAAGAVFQAVVTLDQRIGGAVQAAGTMGHQNLLGMMLHLATLPLLTLLLAGERHKLILAGVIAGLVAVALGASRGSIGFAGIGLALVFAMSIIRRSTPHKWKVFGFGLVALAFVVPLSLSSLNNRFETKPLGDGTYDERAAFERAATMMWNDNPMGVGANQYVVVANGRGYSARAGVIPTYASRAAKVHNMYLLVAAETGWLGLISFVALLLWAIARGIMFAFANRRDPRGDIVLGATAAIIVVAAHGFYEWIFVMYQVQCLFAISLGIIAGNIRASQREVASARKRRQQEPEEEARHAPGRVAASDSGLRRSSVLYLNQ